MEFKHDANKLQPELLEPKFHIHKEGCGHCGLTGGRIYFFRLAGNSKDLATIKIIPERFTILPQDMMDLSTQVAK